MRKYLLPILLLATCNLLLSKVAVSQDFTNKGKDFWITFPAHVDANLAVMGIYITSDKAASGEVIVGNTVLTFSITPNTVKRFFLGPNGDAPNTSVYMSTNDGIQTGAAIHVKSTQPVVVYAHIVRSARSASSLILPSTTWGKEYVVPSYSSSGASGANSGLGALTVVAKEANTVIEITPRALNVGGSRAVGTPYTVLLPNPGDVYQVQYQKDLDISGTKVRSIAGTTGGCNPIAVFSSTTWSAFNCFNASGGDNLYQQVFPTRSFGKVFLTAPFLNRQKDIIRVFSLSANTTVTRTINGVANNFLIPNNGFYEFETDQPTKLEGTEPIMVVQYMNSQSCDTRNVGCGGNGCPYPADPEMVMLNSVDQTINNITVFSAHQNWVPVNQSNVNRCYLNVIIPTNSTGSFRINGGVPTGTFTTIPGTGFSYLQENVSTISSTNPVQSLTADSSFSCIAYGYGNVESYGYNAGTNVRDRYQFVTIRNSAISVNFPATCINTPFQYFITLPYQPSKITWGFNGVFPNEVINTPVFDSTYVVEGKTLYRYSLPSNYSFPNPGTYPISVTVNNPTSDGCQGEQIIDYEVEVFSKPKPNFSINTLGCFTDSVKLLDKSDALPFSVAQYRWQLGDGAIDSVKNPVRKYAAVGTYSIKQTIVNSIGCQSDTTIPVTLIDPPTAGFTIAGLFCTGSNLTFTDTSKSASGIIAKWFWNYGNGITDTLTSNSPRIVTYPNAGTYTVTLMVELQGGCRSVLISKQITIGAIPVANFVLPGNICLPAGKTIFTNSSTIAGADINTLSYVWDFSDGTGSTQINPEKIFTAVGNYQVKLVATSALGCIKDTLKLVNNVFAQTKTAFDAPTAVCLRDSAQFTDNSVLGANQTIANHFWLLGDGTVANSANFKYRYLAPSTYTIQHYTQSDKGCYSDTLSKSIIVHPLPVASWTISNPVCQSQLLTLTSTSTPGSGTINRFWWSLGDGTLVNAPSANTIQHIYTTSGSQKLQHMVAASTGCLSDTITASIVVNPRPTPGFIVPDVCLSDAFAAFTNTSVVAGSAALTYQWSFGDPNANAANPNTSTSISPLHRYTATGNYTVQLIVNSAANCKDTLQQTLVVNGDNPKADFSIETPGNLCANNQLQIKNTSTVNFGSITKVEIYWNWPALTPKTTDNDPTFGKLYNFTLPDFNTPASQQYQIRLVAYSGIVCVNQQTKNITVNARPKVQFITMPGICLSTPTRMITQGSNIGVVNGNGIYKGIGVNAAGLFNTSVAGAGTHTIGYVFTSTAGCMDSANKSITVWPRPLATFKVDSPTCVTRSITFRDASTTTTVHKIVNWQWTFGDNTNALYATNTPFTKVYANTGSFSPQLITTSDSACVSLPTTVSVKVNPLPIPNFSLPIVCLPSGAAQFTNQSTIADGSIANLSYNWSFGVVGSSSSLKDPIYKYTSTGPFDVRLKVTSNNGCVDSLTKQLIDINVQPKATFTVAPAFVCFGAPFVMTNTSVPPAGQTISSYVWKFGDGSQSTNRDVSKTYAQSGTFTLSLSYKTAKDCPSDTVQQVLTVHPYPVVNAGPDLLIPEGAQSIIKATATGSSNYTFAWTPDSWLTAADILQPITKPEDDIVYTLNVSGAGGCATSDAVNITLLRRLKVPSAFSPNGDGINDVWEIKYIDLYPGVTVQLFDRYGHLVFSTIGYSQPWKAEYQGKPLPVGTYYYVIDLKNGKKPTSGAVTVVR